MLYRFSILPILCALLLTAFAKAEDISPQRLALLRGAIALAEGNAEALTDLQQAAQFSQEDWRSQLLYGEALALTGQTALAKGQLKRAALLAPSRPEPWQAIVRLGLANTDLMLEYAGLAGLMRLFPNDPVLQYRMAAIYRRRGNNADADKVLANWQAALPPLQFDIAISTIMSQVTRARLPQFVKEQPHNPHALHALAALEWEAGDIAAACDTLRRAMTLAPNERGIQRHLVHLLLASQRTEEALQVLRAVPPGDDALERALATWSIAVGRYADAIPPLRRLLERRRDEASLYQQLAIAAFLCDEQATALAAAKSAWTKRPDHLTGQLYAAVLLEAGQHTAAETVLNEAIRRYPRETLLHVMLARLYLETKRGRQAAELTEKLAAQRWETVELLILAGERFLSVPDHLRPRLIAAQLRDRYPADLTAFYGSIALFRRVALSTDTGLALTRFLGPNMTPPLTRSALLCEIARYAIGDNRLAEAEIALEELLRTDQQYPPAYLLMGRVYQQQEAWAEAVRCYQTAHELWKDDPSFALALARAARKAGNLLLALDAYRATTTLTDVVDPWLEMGEVYAQLDDMTSARACWQTAAAHPAGQVRAQRRLLACHANDPDAYATALTQLLQVLSAERDRRAVRWRAALSAYGLSANDDEIAALLLLAPDLIDPASLQQPLPLPAVEQQNAGPADDAAAE